MIEFAVGVVTLAAATIGHLYIRTSGIDRRLTISEASVPEILGRIEMKLDLHIKEEDDVWDMIRELDRKVDGLVTDVAVMKGNKV